MCLLTWLVQRHNSQYKLSPDASKAKESAQSNCKTQHTSEIHKIRQKASGIQTKFASECIENHHHHQDQRAHVFGWHLLLENSANQTEASARKRIRITTKKKEEIQTNDNHFFGHLDFFSSQFRRTIEEEEEHSWFTSNT
jgi:ABC-type Zn2+ transport system substrate-binding protein/surface adhesin